MRALGSSDAATASREQLEAALIGADCGVQATMRLLQAADAAREQDRELNMTAAVQLAMRKLLEPVAAEYVPAGDFCVILLTGANGSGKTTTAAKLCRHYGARGLPVMLAAADTFRAAAIEQLGQWAELCGVPIVSKGPGADPAAVCYEAVQEARQHGSRMLVVDTAGRQHNNEPMLQELQKMRRALDKSAPPGTSVESWMALDATTGQNCMPQALEFSERAALTGVVVTKLDGSAKGGMLLPVAQRLQLPVRFIGLGEGLEDLQPLDAAAFAQSLVAPPLVAPDG